MFGAGRRGADGFVRRLRGRGQRSAASSVPARCAVWTGRTRPRWARNAPARTRTRWPRPRTRAPARAAGTAGAVSSAGSLPTPVGQLWRWSGTARLSQAIAFFVVLVLQLPGSTRLMGPAESPTPGLDLDALSAHLNRAALAVDRRAGSGVPWPVVNE